MIDDKSSFLDGVQTWKKGDQLYFHTANIYQQFEPPDKDSPMNPLAVVACAEGESFLEYIHDDETFHQRSLGAVVQEYGADPEVVVYRSVPIEGKDGARSPSFCITQRRGRECPFAVITEENCHEYEAYSIEQLG